MVYQGPAIDSMTYFSAIGHAMDTFTNPADYYMSTDQRLLYTSFNFFFFCCCCCCRCAEILHSESEDDIARVVSIADDYRKREPALIEAMHAETDNIEKTIVEKPSKRPGFRVELGLLSQRTFRMLSRNPVALRARTGQAVVMALMAGNVDHSPFYLFIFFVFKQVLSLQSSEQIRRRCRDATARCSFACSVMPWVPSCRAS